MRPRLLPALAIAAALLLPAAADAAVTPLGLTCTVKDGGARQCGSDPGTPSLVSTFDGVPLDVNVALPPASAGDGPFPLVVLAHGWGGQKSAFTGGADGYAGSPQQLAEKGYAVLSPTARGFNGSCGTPQARLANPATCATGWIRLDDYRFEAMDIEYLAGRLVDDGVARPAIGVTGPSYGGGVSLELAILKNRMCSDLYGATHACPSLAAWASPKGTPMSIAAAAPIIPWSDLVYSLMPNGRTLDYTITNPYTDTTHRGDDAGEVGVMKQSYVSGLYATGNTAGYIQPTPATDTTDRKADLTTWFARVNAGEPYTDSAALEIVDLIARFRSPYNLGLPADGPAPLFISNGFTDDLFPPDEALRFANRVKAAFPDAPLSLLFADHGHARGTNSAGDVAIIRGRVQALFDHYLLGAGAAPASDVTAYLQACPSPKPAASPGPYTAASWPELHPGEVRFLAKAAATVPPQGDPQEDRVSDPIAGGNACASVSSASDASGSSTYRLPQPKGSGYTLLGSPTVIGEFAVQGGTAAQVVGRLWDVAPDGSETLVAKGIYRPVGKGTEVFQLHANGWRFATGHTPRLELLGSDSPYVRRSNSPAAIAVTNLQLRLPVAEKPDCSQVLDPAAPVLPETATGLSRTLAPGVSATAGGSCASPAQGSTGATTGTAGGAPVTTSGQARKPSSGGKSTGTGGKARPKPLRVRIVFGRDRVRDLRKLYFRGVSARVTCSKLCRVVAELRWHGRRLAVARRTHRGSFRVRVKPSYARALLLTQAPVNRVRLRVTVSKPGGKRVKRRTAVWVVPLYPKG